MASIKSRVASLEQTSGPTVRRKLTDAELAVRVTTILNNPASSPLYGPLTEFMNRAVVNNARCQRDVPEPPRDSWRPVGLSQATTMGV